MSSETLAEQTESTKPTEYTDKRIIEYISKDTGDLERASFMDIKKGMIFRLFEPNWETVYNTKGGLFFIAQGDAYIGPFGPENGNVWTVMADDYDY